jgi:hypothetical protein
MVLANSQVAGEFDDCDMKGIVGLYHRGSVVGSGRRTMRSTVPSRARVPNAAARSAASRQAIASSALRRV